MLICYYKSLITSFLFFIMMFIRCCWLSSAIRTCHIIFGGRRRRGWCIAVQTSSMSLLHGKPCHFSSLFTKVTLVYSIIVLKCFNHLINLVDLLPMDSCFLLRLKVESLCPLIQVMEQSEVLIHVFSLSIQCILSDFYSSSPSSIRT